MFNHQNNLNSGDNQKKLNNLHICLFSPEGNFTQLLRGILSSDRYALKEIDCEDNFIEFVENQKEQIDCLVFLNRTVWQNLLTGLKKLGVILPVVIVNVEGSNIDSSNVEASNVSVEQNSELYHSAEIQLDAQKLEQIPSYINFAITQFLNLAPSCSLSQHSTKLNQERQETHLFLASQQQRLAEKLKERLGYLGIYYKRNPRDFYQNLDQSQKQQFFQYLSEEYRKIILAYFEDIPEINQWIDNFVDQAFFADISISQILEIHMELMDEFAQQLKLEGRSEEILLDYRLALIDIIAHLCEMYRRSIPREHIDHIPFNALFPED
ncbi:MAG: circadian clock protein KaiA [Xenococcaceae cyanobacterium MO_188.B19]|nr:circadian clock protein KaiA [Xenococcaceae cyanobacterium MO_188.B19]